jgi:hypothetical protein
MESAWIAGVAGAAGFAAGALCAQPVQHPAESCAAPDRHNPAGAELAVPSGADTCTTSQPESQPAQEPEPEPVPELTARKKVAKAAWKAHRKHRRLPLEEPQLLDGCSGAAVAQPCWANDPTGQMKTATAVFTQLNVESNGLECGTVRREVVCGDALGWLRKQHTLQGHVVTSLPDIGELDAQLPSSDCANRLSAYRKWFVDVVTLILSRLAHHAVAVFYQSDGKHMGTWLDKSYLCQRAAEQVGCHLLFHKIALFDSDLVALGRSKGKGRPQYSHMIAFSRTPCTGEKWFNAAATPDIFARGQMLWKSAMGEEACVAACLLIRAASKAAAAAITSTHRDTEADESQCSGDTISNEPTSACAQSSAAAVGFAAAAIVIDPFCGQGTVLAVANELGMDALGVELSRKRCRQALQLRVLQAKDAPALWQ